MSDELGLATTNISAGARIRSCWTRRRPLALRIFIPGLVGFEYSTGGPVPHLPRINLAERFQQMIAVYNAGSQNVQLFFEELLAFAKDLGEEEKRAISEGLSEQELAVFDLLTKPEPKLNKKEEQEVKTVAKERLETLKREALVLDWRKKQQARASVWVTVEKA
jgi:Domain of unknown function (DUF3387)